MRISSTPSRRGVALDRPHQFGHLRRERVAGQQRAGIDDEKQKPVILRLAARDRRAGKQAQGLNREGKPVALVPAERRDAALRRFAPVGRRVAVGVEGEARRQFLAGFGGQQYLAPHQRGGADIEDHRTLGRRKAEGDRIGAERRAGRAGRHDVRRARCGVQPDKSGLDDAFEVIGVAAAEIAVVDADRRDAALFCLGDSDLGAAIDRDIADIVAAIDQRRDRRLVDDGNRPAGVPGLRLARDREDARQPGEAVAAQRIVDQLVGDDTGVVVTVADAGERPLAKRPRLADPEPHGIRPVRIEIVGALAHASTIGRAAASVKTGPRRPVTGIGHARR